MSKDIKDEELYSQLYNIIQSAVRNEVERAMQEKDDKVQTLDGHIATNNYEHPNMVALAIIDQADAVETEEWKRFELPFDYERFGKTIDLEKLAKGQYNISIILSASKNGDEFKGAPGSTLLIDDLEIEYK